tara:strand:- start:637 stop:816 length:180 start_codon:yes stop_codon:yes gene_type:complete
MSKECCGIDNKKQAKILAAQFIDDLAAMTEDYLNKGWFPAGGHIFDGTNYSVLIFKFPK